jgi:UDP-glucose 4-epimerase
VEEYKNKFNLKYSILRFGSIYGERSGSDNGIRQILEHVIKRRKLIYKGTKNSIRSYIYVKDAVKLCLASISKKYDNQYLTLTGERKIKAKFLFNLFSKMFKISDKNITFLKNKGHYDVKPTIFKPRIGKILHPFKSDFKKNIIQ